MRVLEGAVAVRPRRERIHPLKVAVRGREVVSAPGSFFERAVDLLEILIEADHAREGVQAGDLPRPQTGATSHIENRGRGGNGGQGNGVKSAARHEGPYIQRITLSNIRERRALVKICVGGATAGRPGTEPPQPPHPV